MENPAGFVAVSKDMPYNVLKKLNDLRTTGTWCDLRIEIPSPSDVTDDVTIEHKSTIFQVHSCVVAAASSSLAVIADSQLEHALLADMNADYVELCLSYIYGQEIFVPSAHISGLSDCAMKLQLQDLVDQLKEVESRDERLENAMDTEAVGDAPVPKQETIPVKPESPKIQTTEQDMVYEVQNVPVEVSNIANLKKEDVITEKPQLLSCSLCPLKFKTKHMLDRHVENHVKGDITINVFKCYCGSSFSSKNDFSQHRITCTIGTKVGKAQPIDGDTSVSTSNIEIEIQRERSGKSDPTEQVSDAISESEGESEGNNDDTMDSMDEDYDSNLDENDATYIEVTTETSEGRVRRKRRAAPSSSMYDDSVCFFEDIAEELNIPEDVLPELEMTKWPEYLKTGRFKRKPRLAYRHYYEQKFKKFKCDKCGEVIYGKQRYRLHEKMEMGKFHYCSFCPKKFVTVSALNTHEMRHKEEKNWACEECDFKCYYRGKLLQHMEIEHSKEGKNYLLCSQCPKVFKNDTALKLHVTRVHKKKQWKEKGHKCDQCSYIGFSKREVALHAKKHSSEKPFVCYVCRRVAFKRKSELAKHIKEKHNQEPNLGITSRKLVDRDGKCEEELQVPKAELLPPLPKVSKIFKCPYCEYTSPNAQNIKAHVVIHFDDRPFACPVCQLAFKRKNVMVRHAQRLHKLDLRNVCYEKTEAGKKKRKELDRLDKIIVVDSGSDMQTFVRHLDAQGAFLMDEDMQQGEGSMGGAEFYAETVLSDSAPGDVTAPLEGREIHVVDHQATQGLDIREVVVDSGSVVYVTEPQPDTITETTTLTVPITDSTGMSTDTEIVIDPSVLKAMGLENFSASSLKIMSDS